MCPLMNFCLLKCVWRSPAQYVLVLVRVFSTGRGQHTSEIRGPGGDMGPSHSAEILPDQEERETSGEKSSLPSQ